MIQRGEPASFLSLLVVAIVFGMTIYLAATLVQSPDGSDLRAQPAESPTGSIVAETTGAITMANSICTGDCSAYIALAILVSCALAIGAIELTKRY